jgi:hypothetical protein
MKRTANKTIQRRKLVVRSEAIAVLTSPQLTQVRGADDPDSSFRPQCEQQSARAICAEQ